MHKLPLPDELPYQFQPPRLSPFWVRASRLFGGYMLRRLQVVRNIHAIGLEQVAALKKKGDGVLITPNHPDLADPAVLFALTAARACLFATWRPIRSSPAVRG